MIQSIQLTDTPIHSGHFSYLFEANAPDSVKTVKAKLTNGIQFNPYINILIGPNGSGKSTVLNLLNYIFFCTQSFESEYEVTSLGSRTKLLDNLDIYPSVTIKANYDRSVFHLYHMLFENTIGEDLAFKNRSTVSQFMNLKSRSHGQNMIDDVYRLLHILFEKGRKFYTVNELIDAGIKDLKSFKEQNTAKDYYQANNDTSGTKATIIMDEPDQGLDVLNIKEIYPILSDKRDDIQIIVSIHSPILIEMLSQLDYVNIIDLSGDYLKEIDDLFEIIPSSVGA